MLVNSPLSLRIRLLLHSLKDVMMIWKKWKKAIIPLLIAKIVFLICVALVGEFVNISRDVNYGNNYQELNVENDSMILKQQKFIRIVRNEEERGVTIILRERKNSKAIREKQREMPNPIID